MGQGYGCACKKCGYNLYANLGVGFLFPKVYQETVAAMKKGEYGAQGKIFFEEHPDGAIACDTVVARCTDCGEYLEVPDLTMYVPKKDYNPSENKPKGRWSVAFPFEGADYVSWSDLEEHYDFFEKYNHKCSGCCGTAEIIDFEKELNSGNLACAKCDGKLEVTDLIMWD